MDDEKDVLAARPTPFVEVRPQPGVLRHTVEHIIDVLPCVQVLMCLLVEVLQNIDTLTPEQVIGVPKIFPDRVPQRLVERRPPQKAEQLMEVPTVVSFVEQNVDIPFGRGRGAQEQVQRSALWSRSLTFLLVEVFTDWDRFQQLHPHFLMVRMRFLKGFSHFSPFSIKARMYELATAATITGKSMSDLENLYFKIASAPSGAMVTHTQTHRFDDIRLLQNQ